MACAQGRGADVVDNCTVWDSHALQWALMMIWAV